MELLIPGLILVALMAYVSTRIKRSAARAFEPELIDTEAFSISKPDGLLSRIEPFPPSLFEAYSKDFGEKPFETVRRLTADVRAVETGLDDAADEIRGAVRSVVSERSADDGIVIEAEEVSDAAEISSFYRLGRQDGRTLILRIAALGEPSDEIRRRIEELLVSFRIK